MRVIALSPEHNAAHLDLIKDMHRLRRRVFKDRLGWDVSVVGDMEADEYDALGPTYLIGVTSTDQVIACVRLLPTTGSYMLASTFPVLLADAPAPRTPTIAESSRFCVDTDAAGIALENGLRQATSILFTAMVEWGLLHQISGICTVTDLRVERILTRAGWSLDRYAEPRVIGNTKAVAGLMPVSPETLAQVRKAGGLGNAPVLQLPDVTSGARLAVNL